MDIRDRDQVRKVGNVAKLAPRRHAAPLKLTFNPDQPRAPEGTSEGGQWVSTGTRKNGRGKDSLHFGPLDAGNPDSHKGRHIRMIVVDGKDWGDLHPDDQKTEANRITKLLGMPEGKPDTRAQEQIDKIDDVLMAHPIFALKIVDADSVREGVGGYYDTQDRLLCLVDRQSIAEVKKLGAVNLTPTVGAAAAAQGEDARQRAVVAHELGHHVLTRIERGGIEGFAYQGTNDYDVKEVWGLAKEHMRHFVGSFQASGEFDASASMVSLYAGTSYHEWFAESWSAYTLDPEGLKAIHEPTHALCDEIMGTIRAQAKAKRALP